MLTRQELRGHWLKLSAEGWLLLRWDAWAAKRRWDEGLGRAQAGAAPLLRRAGALVKGYLADGMPEGQVEGKARGFECKRGFGGG